MGQSAASEHLPVMPSFGVIFFAVLALALVLHLVGLLSWAGVGVVLIVVGGTFVLTFLALFVIALAIAVHTAFRK